MEVGICIFPGPPGSSKCHSDLQLIERPTENLLFATLIPLDCYRIPCLFQLNFFSFFPFFRHIFFSSLFPSFLFFTLSKRTRNSFVVTRQTLDVLFTLIFISIVIDASLFTLIYLYLFAISYWYWCSFYTIIWIVYEIVIEAVVRRCYVKKVFLEILQNSQENTCARRSFLIKLYAWDLAQMFSCQFCEILRKPFFIGHLWWLLLLLKYGEYRKWFLFPNLFYFSWK